MNIFCNDEYMAARYEDLAEKSIIDHDDDGNKIKEIKFDEYGRVAHVTEYDVHGNMVGSAKYSWFYDGELDRIWEYNGADQITRESWYLGKGSLCSYREYEYSDNGLTCKATEYDGDGNVENWAILEYDGDGNDIRKTKYNADGDKISSRVYEYNETGEATRETHYDGDGTVTDDYDYTDYNEN